MRAIVGVTEFKAEFAGMLNLHERFEIVYFNLVLNSSKFFFYWSRQTPNLFWVIKNAKTM